MNKNLYSRFRTQGRLRIALFALFFVYGGHIALLAHDGYGGAHPALPITLPVTPSIKLPLSLTLPLPISLPADGAISQTLRQSSPQLLAWERENGKRQLQALRRSYPDIVTSVAHRNGDWAVKIRGEWFYWAYGRLLPEDDRDDYMDYTSIRFYTYYRGAPRMRTLTPEQEERVRQLFSGDDRNGSRPTRHNGFLNTLYGVSDRRSADQIMRTISFLGYSTTVHPLLIAPLGRVEQKIVRRAAVDREVREFIDGIHSVSGYVWRNIRGTNALSYHSYGTAVDLLHTNYGSAHIYWRWSAERGADEWWKIPIADRWAPPQAMIDIFESEGFVWGGKWLLFDNLHFEYRPEIFLLQR